ncbi:molybdopterin synthase catalytic subunit-like [Camellia sinensis]|uniref:molybdopterin synthase catalytic subunit-like n=1 Tax=Camellia sinensis TaxID=4442 RepID=UPI001035B20D|nr:molybdopterin synthase catalytic subunit-like [Camellia sinensis]
MIIDKTHEAVPGKPIATSSSPRASTAISPSPDPRKQSPPADLYVNDCLTIHGVDGVLDPNSVSKCMFLDQMLLIKSGGVDPSPSQSQSPLDHAVKALRGVLAVSHTIDELKHSSAKKFTRDTFDGNQVLELRYEAYLRMTIRCTKSICSSARSSWNPHSIAVAHRLGPVPVGHTSVFIAVSVVHRAEGLDACKFLIDEIKAPVPI